MKFKSLFLFAGCLFCIYTMQGQELERMVVGAAGTTGSTAGEELSFTVGEIGVETEAQGSYILNQGFHQTKIMTTGIENHISGVKVSLFPNPTKGVSQLELITERPGSFYVNLAAANGKTIPLPESEFRCAGEKTLDIDFSQMATGYYLLTVTDQKGTLLQSFKVLVE